MRAVTGTMKSSKPVSLSKASSILSRFTAADIGARREVAAYLKRAASAFEDLVCIHRELRREKREIEQAVKVEDVTTCREKKKRKDKEGKSLGIAENGDLTVNVKQRKKSEVERRDFECLKMAENGNLGVNVLEKMSMVKAEVKVEKEERQEWNEDRRTKEKKKRKHLSVEGVERELEDEGVRRKKQKERKIKVEE